MPCGSKEALLLMLRFCSGLRGAVFMPVTEPQQSLCTHRRQAEVKAFLCLRTRLVVRVVKQQTNEACVSSSNHDMYRPLEVVQNSSNHKPPPKYVHIMRIEAVFVNISAAAEQICEAIFFHSEAAAEGQVFTSYLQRTVTFVLSNINLGSSSSSSCKKKYNKKKQRKAHIFVILADAKLL